MNPRVPPTDVTRPIVGAAGTNLLGRARSLGRAINLRSEKDRAGQPVLGAGSDRSGPVENRPGPFDARLLIGPPDRLRGLRLRDVPVGTGAGGTGLSARGILHVATLH